MNVALGRRFASDSAETGMSTGAERALVLAAQGGDRSAFATLVRRYQGSVCGLAYALTARSSLAEEVAQETFIVTWRRLGEVKPDSFRSWLYSVARRTSLRALRDHRGTRRETGFGAAAGEVSSSDPSPLERAIDRQEEEFLWRALHRIPEIYRVPLILFYQEDKSIEKVAAMLDLNAPTVRQRLCQGRRLLHHQVRILLESALSRPRVGEAFTAATIAALALAEANPMPGARATLAKGMLAAASALVIAGGLVTLGQRRSPSAAGGTSVAAVAPKKLRLPVPRLASFVEAPRLEAGSPEPLLRREKDRAPVMGFDFEDGQLPEPFHYGHVVPGPARPGNRFAVLAGVVTTMLSDTASVGFTTPGLTYRDSLVLSFDYWLSRGAGKWMSLATRHGSNHVHYSLSVKGTVWGRWAHAAFRLADLMAVNPKDGPPLEPGDDIEYLEIWGGRMGGPPLYIDNIRVADQGDDEAGAASSLNLKSD